MVRFLILLATFALIGTGCASTPASQDDAPAEGPSQQDQQPADESADDPAKASSDTEGDGEGLDARLSSYDYPHDVEIFELSAQRQTLEMAYMDVAPEPSAANGEVVLLLHGKNFSGAYWASTIDALVEEGFRVVVPDQIGFGKSSKPRHFQYSFHGLASYTAQLLDELGVDDVHVVGHSMGGMLATRFALEAAERTSSLTLVNPIGLEDWKRKVPYRPVEWWFERELEKTPEGIKAYMTESYFDGQWKDEYAPLLEIQAGWTQGPDYERIAWTSALTFDMIFTQPVIYEFDLVEAPTLLIIGGRDRTALGKGLVSEEVRQTLGRYPEISRRAAELIPNARLELLEGIGHIPQFEAPERYETLLVDFVGNPGTVGWLDRDDIHRVIREHRSEVTFCYEKELQKDTDLAGRVKVRFNITKTGDISTAQVTESSLDNETVEDCVTDSIRGWKFPKPKGNGGVIVNYPFNFSKS
jgi:TonB family protein